jgi:hypothetical protein
MLILEELCVGCGRCRPFCPAAAIRFNGQRSSIDQWLCYECGACLRCAECPVDAIVESPSALESPRALRGYFSDPVSEHVTTGIAGRGTEESKSNDVTLRVGPGDVGVAIEIGRPTLGMSLPDIQKITRALARSGVHKFEKNNPIYSLLADPRTGDLKPELLGERVLSAIIEVQVKRDRLRSVLRTLKEIAGEVDSVFCVDCCTMLDSELAIPGEVLECIEAEGFNWRPNAKINMGFGRAHGKVKESS